MLSLAIKTNVSQEDQEKIKHLLDLIGYTRKGPKFHCTIGFIENISSKDEAIDLGEKITKALQTIIDPQFPLYEVETATHFFRRVIAFEPTFRSAKELKELNRWLSKKVEEESRGLLSLDKTSEPQNYTPHLTLWHTHRPDRRLRSLKDLIKEHPFYCLSEVAYVLFSEK